MGVASTKSVRQPTQAKSASQLKTQVKYVNQVYVSVSGLGFDICTVILGIFVNGSTLRVLVAQFAPSRQNQRDMPE